MITDDCYVELKHHVVAAGDILRDIVSASEYKDYIAPLLFFKYLSDIRNAYIANEGAISNRCRKVLYKLDWDNLGDLSGPDFLSTYQTSRALGVGKRLNQVFAEFERRNTEELSGVFSVIDFDSNRLGDELQRNRLLIDLMQELSFVSFNAIINAHESTFQDNFMNVALEALAAHRHNTEHVTPTSVSQLVARLVSPEAHDRVMDPFCGTGSMLLACAAVIPLNQSNDLALYGCEKNGSAWAIARMSLFMHGERTDTVELVDIFERIYSAHHDNPQVDVVVSNPPWGVKAQPSIHQRATNDRGHFQVSAKMNASYTAISTMLSFLSPYRGRMAVIVPNGVLSKSGAELEVRRDLILRNWIDAVIGLPPKLFFDTSIAATILLFRKENTMDEVVFIDASKDFKALRGRNHLTSEGVDKIVETYRRRKVIDGYSHLASVGELSGNEFDLNISNYVGTESLRSEANLMEIESRKAAIRQRLQQIEKTLHQTLEGKP